MVRTRVRRPLAVVGAAAALAAVLVLGPTAGAFPVQATGVALDSPSDCGQAQTLMTLTTTPNPTTGTGNFIVQYVTRTDGSVVSGNLTPQASPPFDNVAPGVGSAGISFGGPEPTGTIVGYYVSLGDNPNTAANTGEWFVLYQCAGVGQSTLLYSCFGVLGTCPQNANQVNLTPDTPAADAIPTNTIDFTG